MTRMIEAQCNYGVLKRGRDYLLLDEGRDWFLVRVQGKPFYAFKWVFEKQ